MITIFEQNARIFDTLGLGALAPSEATVTEELNGAYELEFFHPYDDSNKWRRIERGRIVCASTPRGKQPFRIYAVKPDMSGIRVNARHIFYDLLDNLVTLNYTGAAATALSRLKSAFSYSMPFNFSTDLLTTGNINVSRVNPVEAILAAADGENVGFVAAFGGELLRDGFDVQILDTIGTDRGVSVRYGKNLIGLEVTEDESELKTRIMVYGKSGSATVNSPYINNYPYPKIYVLEDSNKTTTELRAEATALLNSGIDLPLINIKVEFIPLSTTVEYKDYEFLTKVFLGDVVTVINSKMGFSKAAKVISYEWDCMTGRYVSIELGDFAPSLTSTVTNGASSYPVALAASTEAKQLLSLISGNITITNNTLYVSIDDIDYTVSARLFRFGTGGLEYSSTGLDGTWTTIITPNGTIPNSVVETAT